MSLNCKFKGRFYPVKNEKEIFNYTFEHCLFFNLNPYRCENTKTITDRYVTVILKMVSPSKLFYFLK